MTPSTPPNRSVLGQAWPVGLVALVSAILSGPVHAETRTFVISGFSEISAADGVRVIVDVGADFAVQADSNRQRLLDRLRLDVSGETLSIGFDRPSMTLFNVNRARVTVSVALPALSGIDASSGAEVQVDEMDGEALTLRASSGAQLTVGSLKGPEISARVESGAELTADGGVCDALRADGESGGRLSLSAVECQTVEVSVSSGAQVSVFADQALSATASSGGTVTAFGTPAEPETSTSSGGQITLRD